MGAAVKVGVRLLSDRVLVRPERAPDERVIGKGDGGSLIAPTTANEAPARGVVVAAGPGLMNDQGLVMEMGVAVGDVVMYGKYAGATVELDDEDLLMLREPDIWMVVEGD